MTTMHNHVLTYYRPLLPHTYHGNNKYITTEILASDIYRYINMTVNARFCSYMPNQAITRFTDEDIGTRTELRND